MPDSSPNAKPVGSSPRRGQELRRYTETCDSEPVLELEDSPPHSMRASLVVDAPGTHTARSRVPLALSCCLSAGLAALLLLALSREPEATRVVVVDRSREACGGNGMLYPGEDACDCFDCFEGPSCSTRLEGEACVVVANSGTPYLFEDYWLARPRSAPLSVLPSYHIGYDAHVPRLEAAIRSLHGLVGNAVTDGCASPRASPDSDTPCAPAPHPCPQA